MPAKLIDGKQRAADIREELAVETAKLKAQGVTPGLAVVLVGKDPASEVYVRNKRTACEKCGIAELRPRPARGRPPRRISSRLIDGLNRDPKVHGILVQLPLPKQIGSTARDRGDRPRERTSTASTR